MGHFFIDQYSLLHFATGIIAYFIGIKLNTYVFLHILFELLENTQYSIKFINTNLEWFWPGGKNKSDTILNAIGDTIFGMLGWIIASHVDYLANISGIYPKEYKI